MTLAPTTPITLADVLVEVLAAKTMSDKDKEHFAAAVRSLCRIVVSDMTSIPALMPEIDMLLKATPHPLRRHSRKTIANVKSQIKAGLLAWRGRQTIPRGTKLKGDWERLFVTLPDARLRNGLSRLLRHASYRGLAPDAMSDAFLVSVTNEMRDGARTAIPLLYRRRTARLWNEAVATVPGWPQIVLTPIAARTRPVHLPLSAFPASFAKDLEDYLRWLGGDELFSARANPRPCKASTIKVRGEVLRLAAATLAEYLGDTYPIVDLRVLVEPQHLKAILTRYWERAGNKTTAFLRGMAITLKSVAQYWCELDPDGDALREIKLMVRKVEKGQQKGLTPKNLNVLRQLENPSLRRRLLDLPTVLADHARRGRYSLARRCQKIQVALAIQLLLVAPMRLQNLSTLSLGKQLQWPNGPQGKLFIILNEQETKNGEPLEFEVPDYAQVLLEEYRDRYRILCEPGDNNALFIGAGAKQTHAATLRDGITKAIQRELGIQMSPHQFRHFAATLILDANPGAFSLVADLLGHKNLKTTISFYSGRRSRQAGQVLDQILRKRKKE